MNYIGTAPSFSLHDILLKDSRKLSGRNPQENDNKDIAADSRYYDSFPIEIVEDVKKKLPMLQAQLVESGLTLIPLSEDKQNIINNEIRSCNVEMVRFDRGSAVVTYSVTIGRIAVSVMMLNVAHRASSVGYRHLSKGSFGQILEAFCEDESYVYKREYFQGQQRILTITHDMMNWSIKADSVRIYEIIQECAFSKICSALKVGPYTPTSKNFDIICYEDAIQFSMEKCDTLETSLTTDTREFYKRMLYCLRVLHSFGIIHKDIKPANIVYSPALQNFVFIDFGVSEWVRQRPGTLTRTFREGTFRYMCPEMKRIGPGGVGLIDLYWNDFYALTHSTQELSEQIVVQKPEIIRHPVLPCIEDELLRSLYKLHTKGIRMPHELKLKIKGREMDTLLSYFPDLEEPKLQMEHQYVHTVQNNVEFMIRAVGVSNSLIRHLRPFEMQNQRISKLIRKLQLSLEHYNCDRKYTPNQVYILIENYQRLLRNRQSQLEQEQENYLQQTALLLHIANIQCRLREGQQECVRSLNKVSKLEDNFSQAPSWAGYAKWLSELLMTTGEPPKNTSSLFVSPLKQHLQNLLIKCIIMKSSRGYTVTALNLCSYISRDNIDPQIRSDRNRRLKIVEVLENVLQTIKQHSEEWLGIASFIWHELLELRSFQHLLSKYGRLVESLDREGRSDLLCYLSFAYRNQGNLKEAMRCCLESLTIRKSLPVVNDDTLARQYALLIGIHQRCGEWEVALTTVQTIIPTLVSLDDKIRLEQARFRILIRTHRLEEAKNSFEWLRRNILYLIWPIAKFCEYMLKHLSTITLTEHWDFVRQKQDYLRRITRYIIKVLEEAGTNARLGRQVFRSKLDMLLTLATVHLSKGNRDNALSVVDCANSLIISYAHEILFGKPPNKPTLEAENQDLGDSLLGQPGVSNTRIAEFILEYSLSAYIYAIKLARLFACRKFEELEQLVLKHKNNYSLRTTIDQARHVKTFLVFLCLRLKDNGKYSTSLDILTIHEFVSQHDNHFTRAWILLQIGKVKESQQLFEHIITVTHDSNTNAKTHEQLSYIHSMLPSPNRELSTKHKKLALQHIRQLSQKLPRDKNLWLNIGLWQMRLNNNREALLWLQKIVMSPSGLVHQQVQVCLVAYSACLNRLGRYRQSIFYIQKVLKMKVSSDREPECLFYISHNYYVMKKRRLFVRKLAKLYVMDRSEEYTTSLTNYLREKNKHQILQVFSEAISCHKTDPSTIGNNPTGSKELSSTLKAIQAAIYQKKVNSFRKRLRKFQKGQQSLKSSTQPS